MKESLGNRVAVEDIIDEYPDVKVYYTSKCKVYGAGKTWEHGEDIGCVLSLILERIAMQSLKQLQTSFLLDAARSQYLSQWWKSAHMLFRILLPLHLYLYQHRESRLL